jgi:hypothetical protein
LRSYTHVALSGIVSITSFCAWSRYFTSRSKAMSYGMKRRQ